MSRSHSQDTSPTTSRFSASDIDFFNNGAFDPNFTAEISNKMRVPKKIRIVGGHENGREGSQSDEMNGYWNHQQGHHRSSDKEKVQMQVPDRIIVTGHEKHEGGKAIPRELQLETIVMPPDPAVIRIQTPPRSITLQQHGIPRPDSATPYRSEDDDETLVVETDEISLGQGVLLNGPGGMGYGIGIGTNGVNTTRGSNAGAISLRTKKTAGYSVDDNDEIEHLREQLSRMNRRLLAVEEDGVERKERERYLVLAGLLLKKEKLFSVNTTLDNTNISAPMDNSKLSDGMKNTLRVNTPFHAFEGLKIQDASFLDEIDGRTKCPNCCKSRKFFCYTCYIPMPPLENRIPQVKLPLEFAIVKHPQEIDGKSTATHGPLLAPESVQVFSYPTLPETEKSILVFPSKDAEDLCDFIERTKSENDGIFPFERVIFVDSTWNQTYRICNDPKLAGLPRVKLCGIESLFWRYQRGNPVTHLATIEAMYHFIVIFHKTVLNPHYDGDYDNLLFFFKYFFHKIRDIYDPKTIKSYATRPYLQQ